MNLIRPVVIYSPRYDISFGILDRLHPFDGRKYSRAWQYAHERLGDQLVKATIRPPKPVIRRDLLQVHTPAYLNSLRSPRTVAHILELGILRYIPWPLLNWRMLRPMRLGVAGTMLAAQRALDCGLAINLSGGYHHCSRDRGEGFTIYSDIAMAIEALRRVGTVSAERKALIIDLDVHQGNGHERIYRDQRHVYIFDMYNRRLYPGDQVARERIDYEVQVEPKTDGPTYLEKLRRALPEVLDRAGSLAIAIYIAGTDVYVGDRLGNLRLSEDDVLSRDQMVFEAFAQAGVPLVMTLGGGYSAVSYRLVANTLLYALQQWGT